MQTTASVGPGEIRFDLNGRTVTLFQAEISFRALIELADVPVDDHRIIQLLQSEQKLFLNLDEVITLTEGARFETVRVYVYFVDTERQISVVDHLSVREILSNAGIDPNDHYLVEVRGSKQTEYKDLNQILELNEGETFISIYHGPTPVS